MREDAVDLSSLACPVPVECDRVTLAHGAGAGASARLIETVLRPRFANPALDVGHDGAVLEVPPGGRLAFTTDSFVVSPLVFPGGDIGSLAVHGSVNDLAMCGARPLALSCALVLEEGLPLPTLECVASSMAAAARRVGVPIVTGDTKVVERGKGDGIFVNTTGLGVVPPGCELRPQRVAPDDAIVVSGGLAEHGVAVLSVREGLGFECDVKSDSAPLHSLVAAMLSAVPELHCLRDPTRGGLGALLFEIASAAGVELELDEGALPLGAAVRAACELLGLDPLFLASEGRCVAFVPQEHAETLLAAMRARPEGRGAAIVGRVRAGRARVCVRTRLGGRRLLALPFGEPLPRIC